MPVAGLLTPQELEATIDTPAIGPAESKVFTADVVGSRPRTLLAPASEAVAEYLPRVTESLQGAIGPVA